MDFSEYVIEKVKQNECLYDLSHGDYKNTIKNQYIWESIGQSLNLDAEAVRKKWKGLRDTYKKRKRAEQAPSGSGASTTKKWKFMDQMAFLDDYPDSRPTIGNCQTRTNESQPNAISEDSQNLGSTSCESETLLEPHTPSENIADFLNSSTELRDENWDEHIEYDPQEASVNLAPKRNPISKRQADAEITSVFKDVMKECSSTIQKIASSPAEREKDRNSTSLLFESLAKIIFDAKIPQEMKRSIESKVVALVYGELSKASQ